MAEQAMTELEIRLSGSGGQGILLIGRVLAEVLTLKQLKVAQSKSYEPTSRGGLSRSDLVANSHDVDYPLVTSLDYLLVLHKIAAGASDILLKESTLVVVDNGLVQDYCAPQGQTIFLPISETARQMGDIRSTNMVALGALVFLGKICEQDTLFEAVERVAPTKLIESSKEAIKEGYRIAEDSLTTEQNEAQSAERIQLASVE